MLALAMVRLGGVEESSSLSALGGIIKFQKLESINHLINCEDEAI